MPRAFSSSSPPTCPWSRERGPVSTHTHGRAGVRTGEGDHERRESPGSRGEVTICHWTAIGMNVQLCATMGCPSRCLSGTPSRSWLGGAPYSGWVCLCKRCARPDADDRVFEEYVRRSHDACHHGLSSALTHTGREAQRYLEFAASRPSLCQYLVLEPCRPGSLRRHPLPPKDRLRHGCARVSHGDSCSLKAV